MHRNLRISDSPWHMVRHFLAFVFAAIIVTYGVLWMAHVRHVRPTPGIGDYDYSAGSGYMTVGSVFPGGAAEKAGLRPGDRIVAIDGQRLTTLRPFYESILVGQNDVVRLTVQRPGAPGGEQELSLELRGRRAMPPGSSQLVHFLDLPLDYYPLGFLIVGIVVLLLRPDDRSAWLLAVLFASFVAGGPLYEGSIPAPLRGFAVAYKVILGASSAGLIYYFFAVFPARSPLDRKIPWLKYALLAEAFAIAAPMGIRCLIAGGAWPLYQDIRWPGKTMLAGMLTGNSGMPTPTSYGWPTPALLFFGTFFVGGAFGLLSLVSNNFWAADAQTRRKAHVMLWGAVISLTPVVLAVGLTTVWGPQSVPVVGWQVCIVLMSTVWPLSFAYAVVKHRVLELPLLLKRSARYLLVQRGFTILLLALWVAAIRLFTYLLSGLVGTFSNTVLVLGLVFGIGLVWICAPLVKRATERIDRAFFRSAYDAQQILESLVEETRAVTSREELAVLLGGEIKQALHPMFAAVYLADKDGQLRVYPNGSGTRHEALSVATPLLQELARRKAPWQASDGDWEAGGLPDGFAIVASDSPDCLVPIMLRGGSLTGVLVLGARLSEEPYSREDKRLLSAVAAQAGGTLENIKLAEAMATRIEAERRIARDMEIAKQVQARLFPQKLPPLETLEYAGRCIQAREVGGDYYDFLSLGSGRVGIVLADIVGKGISGALMMANLQADVRSQCAIASQNLLQFLQSVNQSFFDSTDEGSYATLFFGDYQDATRHLQFVNCGHNPPFLVRAEGTVERLAATATVVGLFEKWNCSVHDVQIASGDLLVIYTDGITEASNSAGEEYGDSRLLEVIRGHLAAPIPSILDAILAAAVEFSGGNMHDDLTVVVARGR